MIVILQLVRRLSECCSLSPGSFSPSLPLSLSLTRTLSAASHPPGFSLSLSFSLRLIPFRLCAFYVDACLPIRPRNVELIKRANPLCEY